MAAELILENPCPKSMLPVESLKAAPKDSKLVITCFSPNCAIASSEKVCK
jgi:hypothetical protein